MLPAGKKSLFEIDRIADPADRLTNAASLLEYALVLLDPYARRPDGAAPSVSDRVRGLGDQLPGGASVLWALQVRNRVVHAQGAPVTEADMAAAAPVVLEAIAGLLPSLAPAAAQALRGLPAAPARSAAPTAAVAFRGLIFDLHARGADGQWGLALMVSFTALGLRGQTGTILIRFLDHFGSPLRDLDGNYGTESGDVAVSLAFTPARDRQDFNVIPVFMPYTQLHLGQGRYVIGCRAEAYLVQGQQVTPLGESGIEKFSVLRTGDDYTGGVP